MSHLYYAPYQCNFSLYWPKGFLILNSLLNKKNKTKLSLILTPKYLAQIFYKFFQQCIRRALTPTCLASVAALLISFLQVIIWSAREVPWPLSLLDRPADTALKCCWAEAKASASFLLSSCKPFSPSFIFFISFSFDVNALNSFSKKQITIHKNKQQKKQVLLILCW